MAKTIILSAADISKKIRRMAYQIYENNIKEEHIIIAGIHKNGFILAQKITEELTKISPIKVQLCEVKINKSNVFDEITTSISPENYQHKSLILVDDVLHTGNTLMYAVKHFLNVPLQQFKTAVLVDRNHKKYPIKVDFKGISLSTSYQNHVEVILENGKEEAYLE